MAYMNGIGADAPAASASPTSTIVPGVSNTAVYFGAAAVFAGLAWLVYKPDVRRNPSRKKHKHVRKNGADACPACASRNIEDASGGGVECYDCGWMFRPSPGAVWTVGERGSSAMRVTGWTPESGPKGSWRKRVSSKKKGK